MMADIVDCDSCFDTWRHFSWVMLNLRRHRRSQADYLVSRFVDCTDGAPILLEIPRCTGRLSSTIKS